MIRTDGTERDDCSASAVRVVADVPFDAKLYPLGDSLMGLFTFLLQPAGAPLFVRAVYVNVTRDAGDDAAATDRGLQNVACFHVCRQMALRVLQSILADPQSYKVGAMRCLVACRQLTLRAQVFTASRLPGALLQHAQEPLRALTTASRGALLRSLSALLSSSKLAAPQHKGKVDDKTGSALAAASLDGRILLTPRKEYHPPEELLGVRAAATPITIDMLGESNFVLRCRQSTLPLQSSLSRSAFAALVAASRDDAATQTELQLHCELRFAADEVVWLAGAEGASLTRACRGRRHWARAPRGRVWCLWPPRRAAADASTRSWPLHRCAA